MGETLPAERTLEQVQDTCIRASEQWVDLKSRSARCGDRDAQLAARRDAVMEHFCERGGLLDQYVFAKAVDVIGVESAAA